MSNEGVPSDSEFISSEQEVSSIEQVGCAAFGEPRAIRSISILHKYSYAHGDFLSTPFDYVPQVSDVFWGIRRVSLAEMVKTSR
jgi:hypothetical protein